MGNILETIAERTRVRVSEKKQKLSLADLRREAEMLPADTGFPFEKALAAEGMSFICEVKKASPSKGLIAGDFPYLEIAKEYEQAGAAAVSVLTEPEWFQGSDEYLQKIAENISIPALRKDFTVDPYMIYEARLLGASAVLLICSLLDRQQILEYRQIAESLGLSALVETHDEREVEKALWADARIVGVNNRDLKDFTVNIENSVRLRKMVPENVLFVSESGMKTAQDIRRLEENDVNAVLIGETLMRSPDKKQMLDQLRAR